MPKYAAVQMDPRLLKPDANLRSIEALMAKACAQGAELAVFPECVVTGYALSAEEASRLAEPVPGPSTEKLAVMCRQSGLKVVVAGMLEKDPSGRLFNTAVIVGPQGLLGRYRKTHLPFLGVDRFVEVGDSIMEPLETAVGRIGVLVCYDMRFPEPARVLALAGAQAILLPTAWPRAASLYPDFVAQTRAAENGVYLVAADRIGKERGAEYLGRSIIVDPNGKILAEAGTHEETILIAEIDPAQSDRKEKIFVPGEYELRPFADRKPGLYSTISQPHKPVPGEE